MPPKHGRRKAKPMSVPDEPAGDKLRTAEQASNTPAEPDPLLMAQLEQLQGKIDKPHHTLTNSQ